MIKIIDKFNEIDLNLLKNLYRQRLEENQAKLYSHKNSFDRALLAEQDFYYDLQTFMRLDGAFLAVMVVDNVYVSGLRVEPYADGYLISWLETDPIYRNRGFAKQLMFALLEYLQKIGCKQLYSHVGKNNQPSLAVHYAVGFQKIFDYAKFVDNTVSAMSVTLRATTLEKGPAL